MESLKEIIKEGNFDCNSNGISFQGVDSSFVALVQLTLREKGFDHFRVDSDMSLGINIENLLKLLKCCGAKDSLELSSQEDSDTLKLVFKGDGRVSEFNHKLMVIDADAFAVPNMNYTTIVRMSSAEFQRIVRDLSTLGDAIVISVDKNGVSFSVEGPTGSGSVTINPSGAADDANAVHIKVDSKISQKFTVRYLASFAKSASLSPTVSIMLQDDAPLVTEFQFPDRLGALRFFLAPKADSDGDE